MLFLAFGTTLSSCWGFYGKNPPEEIRAEAYIPVYGYDSAKYAIRPMPPKPIVNSGKVYVWGNLLFQVEQLAGIHVIDYTDRQNPVKLGYIGIKGCSELAVKGNYLVANNMSDLVTIDISQPSQAKEVSRMKGAFPQFNVPEFNRPSQRDVYFVCPDMSKGDVMGWKLEKNVKDAWCYN